MAVLLPEFRLKTYPCALPAMFSFDILITNDGLAFLSDIVVTAPSAVSGTSARWYAPFRKYRTSL